MAETVIFYNIVDSYYVLDGFLLNLMLSEKNEFQVKDEFGMTHDLLETFNGRFCFWKGNMLNGGSY